MEEEEYKQTQKFILDSQNTYQRIFDDMYEILCVFVYRFYSEHSVCEDCVQEAFISLWECRDKMNSISHVRAFLYQTSRNNILNYLKREDSKQKYLSEKLADDSDQNSWMDFVIEDEVNRILRQTKQKLPPKCGHILALDLQGKSNAEIARLLSVSINTVKTQKRLAYKCLKDNISELFSLLLFLTEKLF